MSMAVWLVAAGVTSSVSKQNYIVGNRGLVCLEMTQGIMSVSGCCDNPFSLSQLYGWFIITHRSKEEFWQAWLAGWIISPASRGHLHSVLLSRSLVLARQLQPTLFSVGWPGSSQDSYHLGQGSVKSGVGTRQQPASYNAAIHGSSW